MRFILGALGGARGPNPFPKPRANRFVVRDVVPYLRKDKERKTLVVTPQFVLQPWQKHARKLQMKASAVNMAWNERREARELRRAVENGAVL